MIESERSGAFDIKVSSVFEGVIRAYQDLFPTVRFLLPYTEDPMGVYLTVFDPPGSLTEVNCSSLYFLNAGRADSSKVLSSGVKAFISGNYKSLFRTVVVAGSRIPLTTSPS